MLINIINEAREATQKRYGNQLVTTITPEEIVNNIKTHEKLVKRINKIKNGEKNLEGTYLRVVESFVHDEVHCLSCVEAEYVLKKITLREIIKEIFDI